VLQLANTADVVRISVNGSLLDEVAFDTAKGFPDIAGASLSFAAGVPTPLSNDAVANWCAAGKIFGAGDLGSPGAANTCLSKAEDLRAGDLVITEIMANPDAVDDLVGEWFELLNRTSTGFDLKGLTVTDAGIDSFTIASSLIAFPGARVVLGVSSTLATNGGIPVDYVYARAQFAIANTEDELIVSNTSVIDAVAYTTEFPATAGASMSLAPGSSTAIANDSAGNWCTATSALASGDHATPGAANDACL
jgi:hypothetical protein